MHILVVTPRTTSGPSIVVTGSMHEVTNFDTSCHLLRIQLRSRGRCSRWLNIYNRQVGLPKKSTFLEHVILMQQSNKQALDHFCRARQTALVTALCTGKVRAFRLQEVLTRQVT